MEYYTVEKYPQLPLLLAGTCLPLAKLHIEYKNFDPALYWLY